MKEEAKKVHAVGVVFEDENGRILVLKRHEDDPEGGTYGLPGGKLDAGENALAAAVREVEEEIGHAVDPKGLEFVRVYQWSRGDLVLIFEVFRVHVLAGEVNVALDHTESSQYKWARPKDLYKRPDLMQGLYPILADVFGVAPR